jgi:hypothetical protein
MAALGQARRGGARRGQARLGEAGKGRAWRGPAGLRWSRHGMARPGTAGRGPVRQSLARQLFVNTRLSDYLFYSNLSKTPGRPGTTYASPYVSAYRHGVARQGGARHGEAGQGKSRPREAGPGMAWHANYL